MEQEKLIYITLGLVVILVIWLWRTNRKIKRINRPVAKLQNDLKMLHEEREILRARMTHAENINLDISSLEDKAEENTQQLVSYIRNEVEETMRTIQYLEERVEELEEKIVALEEKIEEKEVEEPEIT